MLGIVVGRRRRYNGMNTNCVLCAVATDTQREALAMTLSRYLALRFGLVLNCA